MPRKPWKPGRKGNAMPGQKGSGRAQRRLGKRLGQRIRKPMPHEIRKSRRITDARWERIQAAAGRAGVKKPLSLETKRMLHDMAVAEVMRIEAMADEAAYRLAQHLAEACPEEHHEFVLQALPANMADKLGGMILLLLSKKNKPDA